MGGLLSGLAAIDFENRYLLFSSSLRQRFDFSRLPAFENASTRDWRIPVRLLNFLWHRIGYPPFESVFGERVDITHSPHPLILPARRAKTVITIHDLFFLSNPARVEREIATDYPALVRKHARRADAIISCSRFSKGEIVERLQVNPEKVEVIYPGSRPVAGEAIEGLDRDSILFVGRIEHRKNIENLLRAFARVRCREAMLRLVGPPGAGYVEARKLCTELGLDSRVEFTGFLSGKALDREYARARLFVLPSLCEGFGLPLLDAMVRGVPIAASRAASIPEVAAGAALYFDPADPAGMAEALERVWEDEALRARLCAAGAERVREFSVERSARQVLDFYRRIVGR